MSQGALFPACHPVPPFRLAASLSGTAWILGTLGTSPTPQVDAQHWATDTLRRLGVRTSLAFPLPQGAQLWVSNHLSWLDPLIYMSLRPTRALAKAEVAAYPLLGRGIQRIGMRFVERENLFSRAAALHGIARDLDAGEPFLLFPEGTTTHGDHLAPLHEGGLRLAYRLGIQLLPLRLSCSAAHYPWVGDEDLLPHIGRVARARATQVVLHPGEIMDPAQWSEEDRWVEAIRDHLSPRQADRVRTG